MGLTRKEGLEALLAGARGNNPYAEGGERRKDIAAQGEEQRSSDKLKDYLQGQREQQSTQAAQDLEAQYMKNHPGFHGTFRVGPNGTEISENQQVIQPKMFLTPAQEAAEKEAGNKIATYENGGKQAAAANMGQIQDVQNDIQGGKRDGYDRIVGGALENHPTLMSFLAPTEKARRDRVQNAMLGMLHDAGIPRPTQWDIQRVFGQVYDPAADDKTNTQRLYSTMNKMSAQNQAMQNASDEYHKTGYATLGPTQQPSKFPVPQNPQGATQTPAAAPQQQAPGGFDPDAYLKGK